MSLRARRIIARSKHRAAYSSVEIETQFGLATSRPEQRAKNHHPASGAAASDTLAVQSGDEAGKRLRPEACAAEAKFSPDPNLVANVPNEICAQWLCSTLLAAPHSSRVALVAKGAAWVVMGT
jgi:hypothetical protein